MNEMNHNHELPLWRRELDELLESHLDEPTGPGCRDDGANAFGPALRNVYQMARLAMLDLIFEEDGDETVDVEAAREFVEINAMRVVGFVSLQLADGDPALARALLSSIGEGFRESVRHIADGVANELRSTSESS